MKVKNIAGFKSIRAFVNHKIQLLRNSDKSMKALYELMFSESENVMFEESDGFKIIKTTYGQARESVENICPIIRNRIDAKSGTVVGIYMDNSPLMLAVFWAVLKAGFNPLLLNMRLPDSVIENTVAEMNAAAIISDGKQFDSNTILAQDLQKESTNSSDAAVQFGNEFYVMSSGSSSLKICAYTSEKVVEIIENSLYVLKKNKNVPKHYNGELKLLTVLPFYHIFGFVAVYLWFAFFSRTFVTLKNLSPSVVQNTIKRHKVTHVFAVPLFWNSVRSRALAEINSRGEQTVARFEKGLNVCKKLGNSAAGKAFRKAAFKEVREKLFGESICCMISGGSSISSETLEFFNGIGYPLVNGYGMSEIGITSVELSDNYKDIVSCSIGTPFPSVNYKIENGLLSVKGSSLASYVIENGRKIALDGWYHTADLAVQKKGKYFLLGRQDDLIVSVTGENINPNEVERLLTVKGVEGTCLLDVDGALPVLLVSTGKHVGEDKVNDVTNRIKARMEQNNLVSQIGKICVVFEPLVKGDEFKLNRKRLKNDYLHGRLKTFSDENSCDGDVSDELTRKIREYFAVALGKQPQDVGLSTDFFLDEGGTSIDYFALIAKLQQDFNVNFPSVSENGIKTVQEMSAYIEKQL